MRVDIQYWELTQSEQIKWENPITYRWLEAVPVFEVQTIPIQFTTINKLSKTISVFILANATDSNTFSAQDVFPCLRIQTLWIFISVISSMPRFGSNNQRTPEWTPKNAEQINAKKNKKKKKSKQPSLIYLNLHALHIWNVRCEPKELIMRWRWPKI